MSTHPVMEEYPATQASKFNLGTLFTILATLLFAIVFLKNAWITEDAYIIYRSLEQLFAGNGPIWNPNERVQVFTSPLWYWLLAIPRLLSNDHFLNSIIVSLLLCGVTLYYLKQIVSSGYTFMIAVLLLISSNGFMDYSSSGLENPLGYALLALFTYYYLTLFKSQQTLEQSYKTLQLLFITFGLVILTRHDLVTLILPAMGYLLFHYWRPISLSKWALLLLLGSGLFIGWSLFSLFYYGSIFPNTAYAKLNTGIPKEQLMMQGLIYIKSGLMRDTLYSLILFAAIIVSLFFSSKAVRFLGLGLLLNQIYIISVGGDYMLGRFFSYSHLLAIIILCISPIPAWLAAHKQRLIIALPVGLLGYSILYPHTPLNASLHHQNMQIVDAIADERGFYFETNSLYAYVDYQLRDEAKRQPQFPEHPWSATGRLLSQRAPTITSVAAVGMYGYWAGTQHIIVDRLGLSDPLLARLPTTNKRPWRIGHFERDMPVGYMRTRASGRMMIQDKELALFFSKIALITQHPELFNKDRLKAIWELNTGKYQPLLARWQNPPESYTNITFTPNGTTTIRLAQ